MVPAYAESPPPPPPAPPSPPPPGGHHSTHHAALLGSSTLAAGPQFLFLLLLLLLGPCCPALPLILLLGPGGAGGARCPVVMAPCCWLVACLALPCCPVVMAVDFRSLLLSTHLCNVIRTYKLPLHIASIHYYHDGSTVHVFPTLTQIASRSAVHSG
jgi:hypothetical protein